MNRPVIFEWPQQTHAMYVEPYLNGCAYVRDDHGAYVVDFEQQSVTPAPFLRREFIPFASGRGWVKRNEEWILMDRNGREIESIEHLPYQPARPFSQGYGTIWEAGLEAFGFVDQYGRIIAKPQFSRVGNFHDGLVSVRRKDGKYGIMNGEGRIIYETEADFLSDVWDGRCLEIWNRYANSCRIRIVDVRNLTAAAPCEMCVPGTFKGEWAWRGGYLIPYYGRRWIRDNRFGLLALSANLDSGKKWDSTSHERQGYSLACRRQRFYFIDRTLKELGGRSWADASDFSENKAAVQEDGGKWGYIDLQGSVVIKPQFDWADRFFGGRAIVRRDRQYAIVDEAGNLLTPEFDWLVWIEPAHRYIVAAKGDRQYIISCMPDDLAA